MGPPFKVEALYDYSSPHDDDLDFKTGQIITVTEEEDADWYAGEYVDRDGKIQDGIFPRNFVEKFEPETPPRPTRSNRLKKDVVIPQVPAPEPEEVIKEPVDNDEGGSPEVVPVQSEEPGSRDAPPDSMSAPAAPGEARREAPGPKPSGKSSLPSQSKVPPAVTEKPVGGSFKDRIAAFNNPKAAPVTPFKPGGLSGVKKPFIPPPPSKDAYVAPPREPAHKIYRRDEDPELAGRTSEDREPVERSVPQMPLPTADDDDEDQPKPTSLKERIALLQKQQAEQAARHTDAAQKKEKPRRPPRKRTESPDQVEGRTESGDGSEADFAENTQAAITPTIDQALDEEGAAPQATRHRHHVGSSDSAGHKGPSSVPRDLASDANDADQSGAGDDEDGEETSTGVDDSDDKPRIKPKVLPGAPAPPPREPGLRDEENNTDDEAEEEDIDPEERKRLEIRQRMAKMSGGMGMHGMFGPPPGIPPAAPRTASKKQTSSGSSHRNADERRQESSAGLSPSALAPPVPILPLPGQARAGSPEQIEQDSSTDKDNTTVSVDSKKDNEHDDGDSAPTGRPRPSNRDKPRPAPRGMESPPEMPAVPVPAVTRGAPPPPPNERPAPPHPPATSRLVPPPPPLSPSAGEESDDEMSVHTKRLSLKTPVLEVSGSNLHPTKSVEGSSGAPLVPARPGPTSPQSAPRTSADLASPNSPSVRSPLVPSANSMLPPSSSARPPPPPPPTAAPQGRTLSRTSTGDTKPLRHQKQQAPQESEEEVTEYEGDYDTDIASGATHKDALKSHARESDADDITLTDEIPPRPANPTPSSAPPPIPATLAPRTQPPAPPGQPPSRPSRQSTDMPRAAPPPVPPPKVQAPNEQGGDYDPFNYSAPLTTPPVPTSQMDSTVNSPPPDRYEQGEDFYGASPRQKRAEPTAQQPLSPKAPDAPPPVPGTATAPRESEATLAAPEPSTRGPPRQSMEVPRANIAPRRSMEQGRPSGEYGYIASDVDLGETSQWWSQTNTPPPVFQNRQDLIFEIEESSSTKRGGKTIVSKDVYVLFTDYSQTVVTARFDARDGRDVTLEQRHEPPPQRLRQDQLEDAHAKFGRLISSAAASKDKSIVGDGSPQSFVIELLKPLPDALMPIGGRAYGAVVYANLANASVQQHDEIRPGDIITLRNAKFQGHRGPMHQKYNTDIGKPDHVGVVVEWDGTKKKVRAWEQGREGKKVKAESFKLGDLRSGEVKIWRVMGRGWVNWEGGR